MHLLLVERAPWNTMRSPFVVWVTPIMDEVTVFFTIFWQILFSVFLIQSFLNRKARQNRYFSAQNLIIVLNRGGDIDPYCKKEDDILYLIVMKNQWVLAARARPCVLFSSFLFLFFLEVLFFVFLIFSSYILTVVLQTRTLMIYTFSSF